MKKLIALLLAVLLLSSLLVGCAGAGKSMDAETGYIANESPMEGGKYEAADDALYDSAVSNKAPAVTDRKLIRTINLNTETEDMDALLTALDAQVSALGGYIEKRDVYSGSAYTSNSRVRNANLTIRIPKDRLDEFVNHVEDFSNVTSRSENADDVTLSYVATESRMKALQKEEERLLTLIDKAANLTELLELEKRLTEIRTELEQVTSQLLLYDNLVDYGTVTVSIREVQKLTPVEEPSFWSRITTGFLESIQNLWSFLKEFAIFLVVALPYTIPFALIAVIIVLLIRRSVRKRRRARAQKQPPFQADNKE